MIACGSDHGLFIDPDGLVWASGQNYYGQLGLGHTFSQDQFCPIKGVPRAVQVSAAMIGSHSAILDHNGDVWMFGKETRNMYKIQSSPVKVQNLPRIILVSCGSQHTIALDYMGYIWGAGDRSCFGQSGSEGYVTSTFSQVSTPDEMGRIANVSCGYKYTVCQSEEEELWGTGCNESGQLGLGDCLPRSRFQQIPFKSDTRVKNFGCGQNHTVVLDTDGRVWATGNGAKGQLGQGDLNHKSTLSEISGIPPMVHIVCGGSITIMIDVNRIVYACGHNYDEQLAVGITYIETPMVILEKPRITQGCLSNYFSLLVDEEGGIWMSGKMYEHAKSKDTEKFIQITDVRAKVLNEKRFLNTKRALHSEEEEPR